MASLGLGLSVVLCLRVLMPWLAMDAAWWASRSGIGLLHVLALPGCAASR